MLHKINNILRIMFLIIGAGGLLAKLAGENLSEREEIKRAKENDSFQQKEFDDIW